MTSERPASPPIPASSTSTSSPSASTVLVDATGDKWEGQHRTEKNSLEEEGRKESGVVVDAVFGDEGDDGPSYKTLGWKGATVICLKINFGLGVLSIPYVLLTLGAVPGVLVILVIALMTTWASYVMGTTKLRHPELGSIADVGLFLSGPILRDFLLGGYVIFLILVGSSAYLSVSIALNVISNHGACTILFVAVVAIAAFLLASIQTLSRISILGWIGLASVMVSILTVTIAVSSSRPSLAPQTGVFDKQLRAFGDPSFAEAINACGNVLFAFAGVPSFLGVAVEMRNVHHFTRAVMISQGFVTAVYLSIGIVIYFYAGVYVASPALASAGPLISKIAYGLAIPGLLMSSLLFTHIPAKTIFLRMLRNSRHLTKNTKKHWFYWLSCVAGCTITSFILASSIPVFSPLVGFIGALLGSFFSIVLPGIIWLSDSRANERTPKHLSLVAANMVMVLAGLFLVGAGSWGSAVLIQEAVSTAGSSFSCATNA